MSTRSGPASLMSGGEEEEEEEEETPLSMTALKLIGQLQGPFHSCSEDRHRRLLSEHLETLGRDTLDCHGLSDVFNDATFPSVLGLDCIISADTLGRFATPRAS